MVMGHGGEDFDSLGAAIEWVKMARDRSAGQPGHKSAAGAMCEDAHRLRDRPRRARKPGLGGTGVLEMSAMRQG